MVSCLGRCRKPNRRIDLQLILCRGLRTMPNAWQKPNIHGVDADHVSRRRVMMLIVTGRQPWRRILLDAPTSRDLQFRC